MKNTFFLKPLRFISIATLSLFALSLSAEAAIKKEGIQKSPSAGTLKKGTKSLPQKPEVKKSESDPRLSIPQKQLKKEAEDAIKYCDKLLINAITSIDDFVAAKKPVLKSKEKHQKDMKAAQKLKADLM